MVLSQTQYEVEHFGSVLLSVAKCQRCGHKQNDIMVLTNREPVALTARINSLEDLRMRVIKSSTATVMIPDFGATVTPGPYSEAYISNVEGLLEKIEDALTFMLGSADRKRLEKGKRILARIREARELNPNFTLIIKDPLGNSGLISSDPKKVRKRRLTERELLRIKFGQYASKPQTTQQWH